MHATSSARRARWMIGLTMCGALMAGAVSAQATEQRIGTVMGVPQWELAAFQQANASSNSVTVLHVAPEFNSQIVTVSIRRRDTGEPASSVYIPTYGNRAISRAYRQINAFDAFGSGTLVGENHMAVMKVEVQQTDAGSYTPGVTRFLMIPAAYLPEIQASNPEGNLRIVHRQRSQIGGGDRDVVLMAVEPTGRLASGNASVQVPKWVYPVNVARLIRSLNTDVSILGTDVSATGTTTLEVK